MGSWSTASSTFTEYHNCAVGYSNGKIYIFGGWITSADTWMYDPVLDVSTTKAVPPTGVYGAAVVVGSYIYVIHANSNNQFSRYDPVANSWITRSVLPFGVFTVSAYVDGDGNIWAWRGAGDGTATAVILKYTVASDSWSTHGTGIFDYTYKQGAKGPDGNFYSIGGLYTTGMTDIQRFNPTTLAITSMTPLPAGRWSGCSQELGGLIYYISGNSTSSSTSYQITNYAYDYVTNTWSTKTAIPAGRRYACSAVIGTKIYIFGGQQGGTTLSSIHIWNEPNVSLGSGTAAAVASTSGYATMTGVAAVTATTIPGDLSVAWAQTGVEADSFVDVGATGSDPLGDP